MPRIICLCLISATIALALGLTAGRMSGRVSPDEHFRREMEKRLHPSAVVGQPGRLPIAGHLPIRRVDDRRGRRESSPDDAIIIVTLDGVKYAVTIPEKPIMKPLCIPTE